MNSTFTLSNLYECSICLGIIAEPQICTTCTHGFHELCLQKWSYTHTVCPCCDVYMNTRTLTTVERSILRSQQIACRHCKQQFSWPEICSHEISCPKRLHECLCGQQITMEDMPAHVAKCTYLVNSSIICIYCDQEIEQSKYRQHLLQCDSNLLSCALCSKDIVCGNYADHIKSCVRKHSYRCHVCQQTITYDNYCLHVKNCLENLSRHINCTFCQKRCLTEEFQEHLKTCDKNPVNQVTCLWCHDSFSADLLEDHVNKCSHSPFANLFCPWCNLSSQRIGLDRFGGHIKFCAKRQLYCTDCGSKTARVHSERCPLCQEIVCSKCRLKHPDLCPCNKRIITRCCRERIPAMYKESHEESCPKASIICRYCQQSITRGVHKQHLLTDCPDVFLDCKACGTSYKRIEQARHRQKCEQQFFCKLCCSWVINLNRELHDKKLCTVHCPDCNCLHQTVKLKICEFCNQRYCHRQSQRHGDHCPQKSVVCSVCGNKLLQKDLEDHQKNCQANSDWISCEYCKVRIKSSDKFNHLGKCARYVNRKCQKCGIIVHKRFINNHHCSV